MRRGLAENVVGRTLTDVELRGHRVSRRHVLGPQHLSRAPRRPPRLRRPAAREVPLARPRGLGRPHPPPGHERPAAHRTRAPPRTRSTCTPVSGSPTAGPSCASSTSARSAASRWPTSTRGGCRTTVAHIAPDLLEPDSTGRPSCARVKPQRQRDQARPARPELVSGIGNIYADEALWRAQVHGERLATRLTRPRVARCSTTPRTSCAEALGQGGTSFDALYVNVNGASGYFDRSLARLRPGGHAPARRCGTLIRREHVHEPVVVLLPRLPAAAAPGGRAPCPAVGFPGLTARVARPGPRTAVCTVPAQPCARWVPPARRLRRWGRCCGCRGACSPGRSGS